MDDKRSTNIDERLALLTMNTESLHASVHECYGVTREHTEQFDRDAERIRALARIAEVHERRLNDLEGEQG